MISVPNYSLLFLQQTEYALLQNTSFVINLQRVFINYSTWQVNVLDKKIILDIPNKPVNIVDYQPFHSLIKFKITSTTRKTSTTKGRPISSRQVNFRDTRRGGGTNQTWSWHIMYVHVFQMYLNRLHLHAHGRPRYIILLCHTCGKYNMYFLSIKITSLRSFDRWRHG